MDFGAFSDDSSREQFKGGGVVIPARSISEIAEHAKQLASLAQTPRRQGPSFLVPGSNASASSHNSGRNIVSPLPASNEELQRTAYELYLAAGGADVAVVADQSVSTMEKLLAAINDGLDFMRVGGFVPVSVVAEQAEQVTALYEESKRLLLRATGHAPPSTGVQTPSAVRRFSRASSMCSDTGAIPLGRGSTTASNTAPRPTFVEDWTPQHSPASNAASNAAAAGDRVRQSPGRASPAVDGFEPSDGDEEVYDMAVLHPGKKTSAPATPVPAPLSEEARELAALRVRVQELLSDKATLESSVEQLEAQIARMRDACEVMEQGFQKTQDAMERELERVEQRQKDEAPEDDRVFSPARNGSPNAASPQPPPRPASSQAPRTNTAAANGAAVERPRSSISETRPLDAVLDEASPDSSREGRLMSPKAGGASPPTAPYAAHDVVGAMYAEKFAGRGVELLWRVLYLLFTREYDATAPPPDTAESLSFDAAALRRFQEDVEGLAGVVADTGRLRLRFEEFQTPLRSEYIAQCLQHKIKPNSGIVRLLSAVHRERDIVELRLGSNLIGDVGLSALLPLLPRMYRLSRLDLSHNGLKNAGVHALADVLMRHPAVTDLDLSGNALSRAGGKDLLALATQCAALTRVSVDDTQIELALQARIAKRCADNAAQRMSSSAAATPSPA